MSTRIMINNHSFGIGGNYPSVNGGENTEEEHDIQSIEIVDKYHDLTVGFEPEKGVEYYLLYGLHTADDSFNNRSGIIAYVDLFQDEDEAWDNLRRIQKHHKEYDDRQGARQTLPKNKKDTFDGNRVSLTMNGGHEYKYSVPWNGYFERLESISVVPVKLKVGGTVEV